MESRMLAITEGITEENLKEIYSDPYIQRVGHYHRPATPVIHPSVMYISAWVNNAFAGAFMAIKSSTIEIDVHALLKKRYVKYSRNLGNMFLDWAFGHQITRVTAYIIQGLESSVNYCKKIGFKYEGCRRDACIYNGKLTGVYVLGMTRRDYEFCR